MRKFGLISAGVAGLVASLFAAQAYAATAGNGGFTVSFSGGSTVNTGNITTGTTTKTIVGPFVTSMPTGNLGVNGNASYDGSTTTLAGLTVVGPTVSPTLTIAVASSTSGGTLTFSFTTASLTAPITATSGTSSGNIPTMYAGTLTSDTGSTPFITGPTAVAHLSQSCTQAVGGLPNAPVICSDSIALTTAVGTPEPASLALLGSALIGFGWIRRRRKAA